MRMSATSDCSPGAVKGSERWRRILAGYAQSERYAGCFWHVREPSVARRLAELASEPLLALHRAPEALHLRPWPGLGAEAEGQIAATERAHRERLEERERAEATVSGLFRRALGG